MHSDPGVANVVERSGDTSGPGDFARRALRAASITALVALAALVLVVEGRVLMLLLAGGLFALFLRAASAWIAKVTRAPYLVALAAIAVVLVASSVLGAWYLGAGVLDQAHALQAEVPKAWQKAVDLVRHKPELQQVIGPMGGGAAPKAPEPGAVAMGAAGAIGGVTEALGALVVVFFLGLYGAAQPRAYTAIVLKLVPIRLRDRTSLVLAEIGQELTRWLLGRLVAMLFVGVIVAIGLLALRVPMALPLAGLAGLLTFVEYVGAVASAIPPALLAFTRGPGAVLGVLALFTVAHVLEGYVLTPFLARTTVRFPPAYTLAGQVVLGAVFGIAGLTFATPTLVIATILVNRFYVEDALGDRLPQDPLIG